MAKASNEIPVNVVREEPAPCRLKLDVEVPVETVDDIVGRVERDYRRYARIPGFRPGKAPKSLLRRHYGTRVIDDAKDRLLREATKAAIDDQNVQPLTVPQVENEQQLRLVEGQNFVFAVEFDVAPEFDLPDYKSLDLPASEAGINEENVEDFIERLLSSRVSYDQVDRPAGAGDLLKATYQAVIDDGTEVPASAKYLAEGKETWVALREPEILPGIVDSLVGVEGGTEKDVQVQFPDDFYETAFAGKTFSYHFEILEVHASTTPELTDDVAKQLGAENAEDVRERVRSNLEEQTRREQAEARRQAVVEQLLAKVDFPVPPALLARESYQVLLRMYQEAARGGTPEEELEGRIQEMRQQADETARRNLMRNFVLEKIAKEESLSVEPDELDATVRMVAAYQGVTEKKCLRRLQESGRLIDLLDDMRNSKTIQRILEINSPAHPGEGQQPGE